MAVTAIFFADIHVIESLPCGYAGRTGLRLHEKLVSRIAECAGPVSSLIRAHYHEVTSAAGLYQLLAVIASETPRLRRAPLLHFETHGGQDGLELASGEELTWEDLRLPLTEINQVCQLNLVVLVAACNGLDLTKLFLPSTRAPMRLIIGPNRAVTECEIEAATNDFYATLFARQHLTAAYNAMNAALPLSSKGDGNPFVGLSAELMFKEIIRLYFQQFRDDQDFVERIEKLTDDILRRKWAEHGIGSSQYDRRLVGAEVKAGLMDHRGHFEHFKHEFFFIDRYPNNAQRFNITFEECWSVRPGA